MDHRAKDPDQFGGLANAECLKWFGRGQAKRFTNPDRSNELFDAVLQAGWATASARDWKDTAGMAATGINPDGSNRNRMDQLGRQVHLTGWPTTDAQAMNVFSDPAIHQARLARLKEKHNNGNGAGLPIGQAVHLASWPTPMAGNPGKPGVYNPAGNTDYSRKVVDLLKQSMTPARLTGSGALLTGCSAGMVSGGQLNPEHSRWLMGYPVEWGYCGATAMQSIRTKRRRSSKRLKKQSETIA
ncbi:hypothetical protein [Thalassovita sp.]|uniref:hypothetical protein n=1 Tax=Thalassovita sp. TaxID=1979401 RepID=UPI002AAF848B|nr:hypothetical protein [Thalassovita sp.]